MSSVDQIFQSTAKLLARITHNVTLVMASQRLNSKLKYIRFLPLDDRRAIMIVVTDTGQVENCIYPKPAGASLDDLNIIAQRPKLAPYEPAMLENLLADLKLPRDAVNVKATTTEKLGFAGRGEGIAAEAVASLTR